MKRIEELKPLSRDHHGALVLAKKCMDFKSSEATSTHEFWNELQSEFRNKLEPHFQIEEKFMVPELEKLNQIQLSEQLLFDHNHLRNILKNNTPTTILIQIFGKKLKQHVRFEEDSLFQKVQDTFSKTLLADIQSACLK